MVVHCNVGGDDGFHRSRYDRRRILVAWIVTFVTMSVVPWLIAGTSSSCSASSNSIRTSLWSTFSSGMVPSSSPFSLSASSRTTTTAACDAACCEDVATLKEDDGVGDEVEDEPLAFGDRNRSSKTTTQSDLEIATPTHWGLSSDTPSHHSGSGTPTTGIDPPSRMFSEEQHQSFQRDGFLIVSDLLDKQVLEDIVEAGEDFVDQARVVDSYFSVIEMGMIFQAGGGRTAGSTKHEPGHENDHHPTAMRLNRNITKAFREVALRSILPRAAAELMQLNQTEQVRVLRDVFMSKPVKVDETCDWHVDDVGFWPEAFGSEKEGINAWIALQDMPRKYQGSMALSPGSHKAEWRKDAYNAVGLNLTFQGGFTKGEVTEMAVSGARLLTTCEMKTQGPEVREKIEATKFVPDIRKGDVVFATRSLFHRTVPVSPQGKVHYSQKGIDHLNRYSVRYVPGSARLPRGWTFEWSIKSNHENEGSTLDSAMEQKQNLLWYPRVWPRIDWDMDDRLDHLAQTELDEMKTQTRSDLLELFDLFSRNKQQ